MDKKKQGVIENTNDGMAKIEITSSGGRNFDTSRLHEDYEFWIKFALYSYRLIALVLICNGVTESTDKVVRLLSIAKILCIGSLLVDFAKCFMKFFKIKDKKRISNCYIKIFIAYIFTGFLGFLIWKIYKIDAEILIYLYPYCILGSLLVESLLNSLFDKFFDFYIFGTVFLLFFLSILLLCDIKNKMLTHDLFLKVFVMYNVIYAFMGLVPKATDLSSTPKKLELIAGTIFVIFFICCCLVGMTRCIRSGVLEPIPDGVVRE